MARPVIGITCYVEPARFTVWEMRSALLPYTYVEHIERAGGQPVILPPAGDPGELAGRLDGLIVAGGGDIDPARYGAAAHPSTGYVREFRDAAEFALTTAALRDGLPYLGICRGMQVLNISLGGSLHQHLPEIVGHTEHAPAPGVYGHLPVGIVPGTHLAKALGSALGERSGDPGDAAERAAGQDTGGETMTVPHYHHQAVDRLGAGLTVSARADDGTVEAVELDSHPFALAVQWHPEAAEEDALFRALVAAARFG
jgi:putative glutamine amidotransferase